MRITVINHLTLDGVMQAPGRADEDTRDGFERGGWAEPRNDEVMADAIGQRMGREGGGLLLGRRTYEDLLTHWNSVTDSPFTAALNNAPKYVVSTTRREPLPWPNSTLLHGDPADGVTALRTEPGGDLVIMGSGVLIRVLMRRRLIDEYVLMIHPVVLGTGRRLFDDPRGYQALRLVDVTPTTTGVLIATYEPADDAIP